jgi:amidase
MTQQPYELSAIESARRIARGELTSEALVISCLDRIAAREDAVHAWAFLDPEYAVKQARAIDRERPRSLLHGVPVGIKDVIDTSDMPTEYNSPIYRGHRPKSDSACVTLLRKAGCVLLGKTVTTEFAYNHPSCTRNPHNLCVITISCLPPPHPEKRPPGTTRPAVRFSIAHGRHSAFRA